MRYRLLGRSGLRVSDICLGSMTFGENWGWGASADESKRIIDIFMNAGGNFIDTANIYTNGMAETILGEAITPDRRGRVVLATKYSDAIPGNDPNAAGNHRKNMVQSVEQSLRRLKTDRLDILYIHTWDFTSRPDEVMRGLDDLVRQGKILYAGISDTPAWIISRCNEMADARGWSPFVVTQVEYSLLERTSEREIIPMARSLDIGIVAWSPLGGGVLTGKYTQPRSGEEKRRLDSAPYKALTERNLAIAAAVDVVAKESGFSSSQVALAWIIERGIIPIVGATRLAHIEDNLRFAELALSSAQLDHLEKVSMIEMGFPHDFFAAAKGFIYGGTFERLRRHRDEGIGITRASGAADGDAGFSYTDVMAAAK
jgi:aryl-alcohol dehydrogenase-like predicted oxidoreductase